MTRVAGVEWRYRPIDAWPGELTKERRYSDFDASWRSTELLLSREVQALGANEVVIQLAVPDSAIRQDEGLRADRKPPVHPGVIVSFETRQHGPLRYHTDVFRSRGYAGMRDDWRHNVRAIALALEALRKVERYGIAQRGEQYAGWKELGSGTPLGPPQPMTVDEATRILAVGADLPTTAAMLLELRTDSDLLATAYRLASKRHHPDVGGNPETFRKITEARELLLSQLAS